MLQSLESALAMNMAISQFALMPGPMGTGCEVAVCLAELVKVSCDAYVVPYVASSASADGIRSDIAFAGARDGILAFRRHNEETLGGVLSPGEVFVSKSGGGRSRNLIHVVGMGSRMDDMAELTVEFVVSGALQAAAREEFRRIAYSPILIGETGKLSAETVARTMLKSVYYHWINDQVLMPPHVLIAVEREETYLEFERVLKGEAPFFNGKRGDEQAQAQRDKAPRVAVAPGRDEASREDEAPRRVASARPIDATAGILDRLSPLNLTAFYFAVRRQKGTARERCRTLKFFNQIKLLFTEEGGEELHPLAMAELERKFNELD